MLALNEGGHCQGRVLVDLRRHSGSFMYQTDTVPYVDSQCFFSSFFLLQELYVNLIALRINCDV